MANPSKRDAAARKVVSAARSIVTYQIGLPEGCKKMNGLFMPVKPPCVVRKFPRFIQSTAKDFLGITEE